MRLEAGKVVRLDVAREVSPHGYFLTDGNVDILLHYSEAVGEVKPGEQVDVFLFYDTQDRLAATMRKPLISLGEVALLEVVDFHPRFGCFLEMGLGRHLLLPFRELPELKELRPQVGDKVFVVLTHDRQGRLVAKVAGEEELKKLIFAAPTDWRNRQVEARVYKPLQMGTFVVCDGGVVGFGVIGLIHSTERTRLLRLGEQVQVRITYVREDGNVNLSMRDRKEVGRDEDSEKLLAFMRERPNGAMPYSDETPADLISQRFGMSKSAFKRAIGKLMREGLVYQDGSWTHLKKDNTEPVSD
ncbi:S1-like domain-containing RNA-binding protein [Paenibacillus filicis]|uniref:S1-like domain-containing RNA-binding protein n=1 Tax=Paenibacillus gyeongsangnamensis TaxID=3388067 RepID=A0ABT4Q2T8_9BACL|nr:S1-like domain-containing RNA-binding protein [Paenibacillus filicis]MCZ8511123.1 S1-like domain-containing RNA-binding protein [Paenibacillus filicis]